MRACALSLLLAAGLAACAVKGYELGWRDANRIAPLLGRPLDGLGGCRHGHGVAASGSASGAACAGLVRAVGALAAALPPTEHAPEALGGRCRKDACSYSNVYERRDVGLALVLPVFRKVTLREAGARFLRGAEGGWRLDALSVRDVPPPPYGPVRIGASPRGR